MDVMDLENIDANARRSSIPKVSPDGQPSRRDTCIWRCRWTPRPLGSPLCGPQRSGKAMAAFAALKRKIQIRCETGHIGTALFALVNRLGAGPEANGDDA